MFFWMRSGQAQYRRGPVPRPGTGEPEQIQARNTSEQIDRLFSRLCAACAKAFSSVATSGHRPSGLLLKAAIWRSFGVHELPCPSYYPSSHFLNKAQNVSESHLGVRPSVVH